MIPRVAVLIFLAALAAPAAAVPICGSGPRITCVVDGDTLWLDGVKLRLAGIDAPELFSARCAAESARAWAAAERLAALLSAGPYKLAPTGETDRFDRLLAAVETTEGDAGAILVAENLARRWTGRRESWCAR